MGNSKCLASLPVIELFHSIQGEALSVGRNAVFLRLAKCNLNCQWCDTGYAKTGGTYRMLDKIVERIRSYPTCYVVITGGEPLIHSKALEKLIDKFPAWYQFEIETNGTFYPLEEIKCKVRYNVSPKLYSSGNPFVHRFKPEILTKFLNEDAIFKFVVDGDLDKADLKLILKKVNIPPDRVWIMAQGKTEEEQKKNSLSIIEFVKGQGYNLSPRLHIWLYGQKKGV